MFSRFKNSFIFQLEQVMVRGPFWRFALILILVVLVALVAGLLVRAIAPGFESEEDAIWWAFLRLTDPGYLGDDEGMAKGTVSTVLTILGAALFTGALIAILVQWLNNTIERLELGLTPVSLDAHFVLAGWNHRVPALLDEIASYPQEQFEIDIVSQVSASKREKRIAFEALSTDRLTVRQLEFDYTLPAYLKSVDPASYDNVVLLASERLKSGAESDARTILGYLLLRDLMAAGAAAPSVLVELSDPDNVPLFENRRGEVIVSPVIVSHMLARVALRRELRAVIDELFSSGGCEIFFRHILDYGFVPGEYTFADLQRAAHARGEIAIGIRWAGQDQTQGGGVQFNSRRDEHLNLNENDELIVLTTDE